MENNHKNSWAVTLLCMLMLVFFICNRGIGNASPGSSPDTKPAAAADPTPGTSPDQTAQLTFDTQILTVGGDPVYLPEFLFWLKYISSYYKTSRGLEKITDWSALQNGMPLKEFFLSNAVAYAAKDRAIEAKAKELGLSLSKADQAEIDQKRTDNIKIYGSESEYLRIVANMYFSEDVFTYLSKIDYLGNYLFAALYGAKGEKCTDEQVSAFVKESGLMCAKYIFLSNTGTDGKALTTEKSAENLTLLEGLVSRLKGSDDPVTLFDTLMQEYNEDRDLSNLPDGRLFVSGAMGKEFENACSGLKENEAGGVVKTDTGYYLILRKSISPDMTADSSGNTLRYCTAYEHLFKNQINDLSAKMKVEYGKAYDQLKVETLVE